MLYHLEMGVEEMGVRVDLVGLTLSKLETQGNEGFSKMSVVSKRPKSMSNLMIAMSSCAIILSLHDGEIDSGKL